MAFHGHPRYTKDIDIWIGNDPANAETMINFIGIQELKATKRIAGRHQDMADLENLE